VHTNTDFSEGFTRLDLWGMPGQVQVLWCNCESPGSSSNHTCNCSWPYSPLGTEDQGLLRICKAFIYHLPIYSCLSS